MALVEISNVTKHYHKGGETIKPLDGVSLDIEKGEFDHLGTPRIAAGKNLKNKKRANVAAGHPNQLSLFPGGLDPVREKLEGIKPDALTPIEAINLLYELKKLSEE